MSKFIMCEGVIINFNNVNYIESQRDKENDCFVIIIHFINNKDLELVVFKEKEYCEDFLQHILAFLNEKETKDE